MIKSSCDFMVSGPLTYTATLPFLSAIGFVEKELLDFEGIDPYRRPPNIKFGGRGLCECGDISLSIYHVTLHDHMIKGSCDTLSSKSMSYKPPPCHVWSL